MDGHQLESGHPLAPKAERKHKSTLICAKCPRLGKKECPRKLCFSCCAATDSDCEAHASLRARKDDNERIFDAVIEESEQGGGSKRRSRPFVHHEEKLTGHSQTVVIFCLQDFCRNKRWSEDVFNAEQKAKRQKKLLQKRTSGLY